MTTETTIDIQALRKARDEAQAAMTAAETESSAKIAALMADKPEDWIVLMGKAAEPVEAAKRALVKATQEVEQAEKNEFWNKAEDTRRPVVDALRAMLVDAGLSAPIVAVRGRITIENGEAKIDLVPEIAKLDMSEIESLIIDTVDVDAFTAQGIDSIDVNVTKIGSPDALVHLLPTAAVNAAGKVKVSESGTTRGGAKVYTWNGKGYGAKDFLTAVFESGHEYLTTTRRQSYDTAMGPTANGLSNLAKATAPKVGATISDAPKTE